MWFVQGVKLSRGQLHTHTLKLTHLKDVSIGFRGGIRCSTEKTHYISLLRHGMSNEVTAIYRFITVGNRFERSATSGQEKKSFLYRLNVTRTQSSVTN